MARSMNARDGRWYCDIDDDDVLTCQESRKALKKFVRLSLLEPFVGVPEALLFTETGRRWAHCYQIPTIDHCTRFTLYLFVDLSGLNYAQESTWRRLMTFFAIQQVGRGLWATDRGIADPLCDALTLFAFPVLTIMKGIRIYPMP